MCWPGEGRRRAHGARRVRELRADAEVRDLAERRVIDFDHHVARAVVRIVERLLERVDGAGADVRLAQDLEPLVARLRR